MDPTQTKPTFEQAQAMARIVEPPDHPAIEIRHGVPRLKGRPILVEAIVEHFVFCGGDLEAVCDSYPSVDRHLIVGAIRYVCADWVALQEATTIPDDSEQKASPTTAERLDALERQVAQLQTDAIVNRPRFPEAERGPGRRLSQARRELGLTLMNLANATTLSVSDISAMERGMTPAPTDGDVLENLTWALNVSADWLLHGDDPSTSGETP
ncbi:MAG: hypothetical protein AAFV53_37880 [Myxococcota bacterium]